MQMAADHLQQMLALAQLARLAIGDQAAMGQAAPVMIETEGRGDPAQDLQIAQPAGALLAIRLQAVGRVLVSSVALLHLEQLALGEILHIHALEP